MCPFTKAAASSSSSGIVEQLICWYALQLWFILDYNEMDSWATRSGLDGDVAVGQGLWQQQQQQWQVWIFVSIISVGIATRYSLGADSCLQNHMRLA